ncbi:hypothetical protein LIER_42368 [Lithospermum erythrorhizon]|uniref:Uncharacterized protein n=1 Tax=Lithospermum erythrorhizon TaxID=34254 RepID=A0AAV3RNK3_LITER
MSIGALPLILLSFLKENLSISLWDLLDLGGLSVTGLLFDEVVPTSKCLSQSLDEEDRLPMSCKFLLSGYHYLAGQSLDGRVSIFAWISLWNRSLRSYVGYEAADRSSPRVASLHVCPCKSSVVNPRMWDSADKHPFDVLRVSADLEEEVHWAAFLATWLCVFVLPAEPLDLIRASIQDGHLHGQWLEG